MSLLMIAQAAVEANRKSRDSSGSIAFAIETAANKYGVSFTSVAEHYDRMFPGTLHLAFLPVPKTSKKGKSI